MAFPSDPSLNDTHTVGSNTWKWNGYAWDKQVAASGGGSGETADGLAQYTYTVESGVLNLVGADANGEFLYNPDFTNTSQHNLSIFKTDNDSRDFRDSLVAVDSGSNFTVSFAVAGSNITNHLYCQGADYVSSPGRLNGFVYDTFPASVTGGSGKIVSLEIIPTQDVVSAGEEFRLPGGDTFDTVVTSFAGFTGAVAAAVTTNEILYHDGSSINGSGDFTFDGTDVILGGDGHFDGGTDGPHQKKIKADEALAAGDPVYITGNVGASDRVTVAKADASDSAKMPAAGIVKTAFSTNQEGYMTIGGSIKQFNTSGYTANAQLYVSPGGGMTSARPISASHQVQKVVRVGRVSATTGTIIVTGANRANDVPNLLHARAGISMDAGGITFSDGTFQSTAAYNAGYTAGNTAPAQSDVGTGDFWFENDTGLYYANVYDGTTLGWLQISGHDGATGSFDSSGVVVCAGVSSSDGITIDGNLNVKNDFEIRNEGGNAVFEVAGSGQNVTIGDVDSAGNGNEIFIRDSHGIITLTASTAVTLNTDAVNLPYQLRHNSDTNTHFAFPANDEITLTTGGVTLAHLTDTFALQQGLSLDAAGITFPDGTFQTTATVTDSYTGHIEVVANKDYFLDPKVAIERTVTDFYVIASVAGGTAELKGTNGSISTVAIGTSGVAGSLANTTLPVGGTLELGVTGGEAAEDLRFAVRYTQ